MSLNLVVYNFQKNGKILKKYICKNHGGDSKSPKITWSSRDDIKSYALILEDPDAVGGNFVHWYIPFIKNTINQIDILNYNNTQKAYNKNLKFLNNLDLIMGKNSLGEIGYHGPCAPDGSGEHRYIFNLYTLNGILNINENNIQIKGSSEFYNILENDGIKIINIDKIEFTYKYKNYI